VVIELRLASSLDCFLLIDWICTCHSSFVFFGHPFAAVSKHFFYRGGGGGQSNRNKQVKKREHRPDMLFDLSAFGNIASRLLAISGMKIQ
jgi:hypothetical protein